MLQVDVNNGKPLTVDDAAEKRTLRRQTILLNVSLWLFVYVVLSVRAPLINEAPEIWRRVLTVAAGALYTYGLAYSLRRAPLRTFWQRILLGVALAMAGATLHACTHFVIYYGFLGSPAGPFASSAFNLIDLTLCSMFWLGFYLTAVSAYLALLYSSEIRRSERSLSLMRAFADDAHLQALRYQVNPHFLFNTLNSVSALVLDRRIDEAEKMLQALSGFYRSTLADDLDDEITLETEIDVQRLYLAIEKVRFADRLQVRIGVSEQVAQCRVPSLLLQPLVENAIKHGVALRKQHSLIEIRALQTGDHATIFIENDIGDKGSLFGLGVGVSNVRRRLEAHYGSSASMHSEAIGNRWVCEINLPLRTARA